MIKKYRVLKKLALGAWYYLGETFYSLENAENFISNMIKLLPESSYKIEQVYEKE